MTASVAALRAAPLVMLGAARTRAVTSSRSAQGGRLERFGSST
jgi:hypothetical protein